MRALHWFRSDLRLRDNLALAEAARDSDAVACVFVFDPRLLGGDRVGPPRVRFLLDCLERLAADLAERDQALVVRRGDPRRVIPKLLREIGAERLTFNRDYGPYARARDAEVIRLAEKQGVAVEHRKDRVIFESSELRTGAGGPYKVYTPYKNAWWKRYREDPPAPAGALRLPSAVRDLDPAELPTLASLRIAKDPAPPELPTGGEAAAKRRLRSFLQESVARYGEDRDLPALDGTSRLSPHLRLGTISVRSCVEDALRQMQEDRTSAKGARTWIDELVWRDFYHGILDENPHVLTRSYRPEYDAIRWNDDDEGFAAWCSGRTGYPIVDAGMRQLASSGWMHNRVRMIVASFLTKDLLIDWRRGERFFMERLVDGDPASNNGGWQWAASTGTDAQPYFRIFNPVSQGKRFDPDGRYVRRFIPELESVEDRWVHEPWKSKNPPVGYPGPIVDHAERRAEALRRYEAARG